MAFRFRLDEGAGAGAADLFVAGQQDGDGQGCGQGGCGEGADCLQRHDRAAFHIPDARPPAAAFGLAPGQVAQGADGVNRIEMRHDEDAGRIGGGMGEAGADAVAETHAAGDTLDTGAGGGEFPGGEIHHAVDGSLVPGRAFAKDPGFEGGENMRTVEGQAGQIHRCLAGL